MGKVVLITNIPTPYRIPLFNELNTQLAAAGVAFKVIFAALTYPRRKWLFDMAECQFAWEVLNGGRIPCKDPERAIFTYSGLGRALDVNSPNLVIVSGFSLATTRLWLRSYWNRLPYLIWSGAMHRKGRPDSLLQTWHRRRLVSRAGGFVAYGTRSRDYLVALGANVARISIALNTVDTIYFERETKRVRTETHSTPGDYPSFLYVGNLEKGKRIDLLIVATAELSRKRTDFVVDIVGSGSQEVALKRLAYQMGVADLIRFHGYRQRSEVVRHLAHATAFLFPSEYDIWGLVLVEAMASGVPCLCSAHAGATPDLIRDGITGFVLDFEDSHAVASSLSCVLDHPEWAEQLGRDAQAFVRKELTIANSAAGFIHLVDLCVHGVAVPGPRTTPAPATSSRLGTVARAAGAGTPTSSLPHRGK